MYAKIKQTEIHELKKTNRKKYMNWKNGTNKITEIEQIKPNKIYELKKKHTHI